MRPPRYTQLTEGAEALKSKKRLFDLDLRFFASFLENNPTRVVIFLIITICLLLLALITLAISFFALLGTPRTKATGYVTEVASATIAIKSKQTIFTGGLKYDQNNQVYREIEPYQPQYVGSSGPQVDVAWDRLLAPLGMVLDDKEAGHLRGTTFQEPDGSWLLTFDVYHSLHCVNLVRQALDPDNYPVNPSNAHVHRLHTDHCLDYIRQALQCSADLTPLTYLWSESRTSRYPVFGAEHTCRDFDGIHEWASQRLGNYTL